MSAAGNGHSSRVPPKSIESEERIIGSILQSAAVLDDIGDSLTATDFASSDYGQIFATMQDLHRQGKPLDVPMIVNGIKCWSHDDPAHWIGKLQESLTYAAPSWHAKHNAETIREKSRRRKLIYELGNVVLNAYDESVEMETVLGTLATTLKEASTNTVAVDPFPTLSSKELFEGDFHDEYHIPGLFPARVPLVIGATRKGMKTTICSALNLCLSSGEPLFGYFPVARPVRSAFISGESGKATTKETAIRQAKTMQRGKLSEYEDAFWCFTLPKLGQPGTVRAIVNYIKRHKIEVLIIDPAYLCLTIGEGASNLFLVGKMLGELAEVIAETGVSIAMAHHTRLGNGDRQFQPPELSDLAWAGFQEFFRAWIMIGRRSRYVDGSGFHDLWMMAGGSAGHSGLWAVDINEGTRDTPGGRYWEVTVKKPSEVRQDEANERQQQKTQERELERQHARQRVLKIYEKFPNGETSSVIRDAAGVNSRTFGPLNSELLTLGYIEPCDVLKSNRTYSGFKLKALGHSDSLLSESDCPTCPSSEGDESDKSPLVKGDCPSDSSSDTDIPRLEDCDVFK